jgi:uncharacterized protein
VRNRAIVDAGPLAGYLSAHDQHHKLAQDLFFQLEKPLVTCEAVLTEASFLVRGVHDGRRKILDLIGDGVLEIDFSLQDEFDVVRSLITKYESVPMSLADACLVRMSEIFSAPVFTFDGDFKIYRRRRKQKIPLIGFDG